MKILGCWYSNNGIHPKIIHSSLQSIYNAKEMSQKANVNVVTCNWSHIQNNPFPEYITLYKMGVHLGIILQILRILYEENKKGNHYDAVSFLEHDVLYPDDYFDRIDSGFCSNPLVVMNLDYIGMNHTGWLDVVQRDEPLHQMSMQYNYAIGHMNDVLQKAILNGNVILEKNNCSTVRILFRGDKPSCHMNHSKHFTNHYDCYAKNSGGKVEHDYWGHYRKYYPDEEKSAQK